VKFMACVGRMVSGAAVADRRLGRGTLMGGFEVVQKLEGGRAGSSGRSYLPA